MKTLIILIAFAILAGCASAPTAAAAPALTPPSCSTDRQCAGMWAAARDWVARSCGMKIQTITDGYIETYGPLEGNAACRVWRDPNPAGGYIFHGTVTYGAPFMGKYILQMLQGLQAALNAAGDAFK